MPGRRTLSAVVIAALLAATAAATWLAYENERDDARAADQAVVRQAALAVRQNVTALASGLRGATALVSAEGEVDGERFPHFAREVLTGTPFSGLSWSAVVTPSGRAVFEESLGVRISRFDPVGGFAPIPKGVDREFLPIAVTYPEDRERRALLGFDLLSDPVRAAGARAAFESGRTRISSPIDLAEPRQPGAVVFAPVYVPGTRELVGVISTGVTGAALLDAAREALGVSNDVTVMDGTALLAGSPRPEGSAESEVPVLGRVWTVTGPAMTAAADLTPAIAYGASGLALTLAAAGLLLLSARREHDLVDRQAEAERRAARESLQVRITEAIEREIEGDARLGSLARTMVPAVGDICVVHEATPGGAVRRVGVAAPDERTTELIRTLPEPPETSPIRAAIKSREPVLYTRVSEDREARRARERGIVGSREEGRELSAEDQLRADQVSNMIVPLVARNRVLGTLSLSVLGSSGRPPLTREDLAFAMGVATHAAVALDNARLYEQQRDIAGILQQALLPRSLPEVTGAEVAVRHRAGVVGTEVGGDFYDLFEVDGGWMAVVGDVCGKGPEAAALTALVRHTLRASALQGPERAVHRVHDAIRSSGEHTYCTLCCAELRSGPDGIEARITTAGHPEPRVVGFDGSVRRLEVTGPLVGALEQPSFRAQDVKLEPGSVLFMCSDGVPEARRRGEVFGEHRLEALLSALSGDGPDAMLARVEQEVVRFVEGRPRDDLALFALRVN